MGSPCPSIAPAPSDPLIGQLIGGRYRVRRRLASGLPRPLVASPPTERVVMLAAPPRRRRTWLRLSGSFAFRLAA